MAAGIQEVWGEEPGADIEIHLIHPGGQSGDPSSPHCTDRAERYVTGDLRTVYFWQNQLKKRTELTYHPSCWRGVA